MVIFFCLSLHFRHYYPFLISLQRSLNKKTENQNIPETAGYIGRQLGFLHPWILIGQPLANCLSISFYIYTEDWRGSHLPNQKCCMDRRLSREVRCSTSLSALSGEEKPFHSVLSYLDTLLCSMLIDCFKGH